MLLRLLVCGAMPLLFASAASADLFLEDFEDSSVGYTTSVNEFSDGSGDYFGRVGVDGITIGGAVSFSGTQGTGFFAAQDIDGEGDSAEQSLTFSGIDISGFFNLGFSGFFAEDDDGSNQDWDDSDFLMVEASIDGGNFEQVFRIANDGSTFNSAAFVDTDLDGVGDGAEITDTFTQFSSAINGTGDLLDLRITMSLNSGDEDIAFDNIAITGKAVPDPTTLVLFGIGGLGAVGSYRRRQKKSRA
ncbi:MAG: PEP-CTERM sorting domain-containing protein [Planctomycetota bacterium]